MLALARLIAVTLFLMIPAVARAQAAGPTLEAATAGVRVHVETEQMSPQESADRAAAAGGGGLGTGGALMIVGGAALVAGLLIGGGAGTAVAIGGVAVGAYGLYVFLK